MNSAQRGTAARACNIGVQIVSRAKGIPVAANLRRWAGAALPSSGTVSLTLRVVTLAEACALNSAYRGKDYATNVLSFNYGNEPDYGNESGADLRGDIVLCAAVVAAEARWQGKTLASHYAHLTVHGVLHLRGYDHHRPADTRRMESLEINLLAKLGYADPYR